MDEKKFLLKKGTWLVYAREKKEGIHPSFSVSREMNRTKLRKISRKKKSRKKGRSSQECRQ